MRLDAERLGLSKYGLGITRPSKATRWLKVMSPICRKTSCRMWPRLNLAAEERMVLALLRDGKGCGPNRSKVWAEILPLSSTYAASRRQRHEARTGTSARASARSRRALMSGASTASPRRVRHS